jgi:hypothetical protein
MAKFQEDIVIKLKDEFSKAAKTIGSSTSKLSKAFSGLQGVIGALAIGKSIQAVTSAFLEQERAQEKLRASLRLTGRASEETFQRFQDLATGLQKTTTFGDEAILAQQAFLASLRFTNDQIEQVTQAAVDLSAATGLTLESSVRNLAKTYSGLSGELGELIPQLRGLSAEQLKAGEGVKTIADLFAGQAQAAAQTYGGQLQQLANNYSDLLEKIGQTTLKAADQSGIFNLLREAVDFWNETLSENIGKQSSLEEQLKETEDQLVQTALAMNSLSGASNRDAKSQEILQKQFRILQIEARSLREELNKLQKVRDTDVQGGGKPLSEQIFGSKAEFTRAKSEFAKLQKELIKESDSTFKKIEEKRAADIKLVEDLAKVEIDVANQKSETIKQINERSAQETRQAYRAQAEDILNITQGLGNDFSSNFQSVVGKFSQFLPGVAGEIAGFGASIVGSLGGILGAFDTDMRSTFVRLTDNISQAVRAAEEAFNRLDQLRNERARKARGEVVDVDVREGLDVLKQEFGSGVGFGGKDLQLRVDPETGDVAILSGGKVLGIKDAQTGRIEVVERFKSILGRVDEDKQRRVLENLIRRFGGQLSGPSSFDGSSGSISFSDSFRDGRLGGGPINDGSIEGFGGSITRRFAKGGMVPGHGFGTDNMMARVSSGEFVVSRRGVNNRTLGMLKRMNMGMEPAAAGSTFNISAIDAASFKDFIRREGGFVMRELSRTERTPITSDRGVTGN